MAADTSPVDNDAAHQALLALTSSPIAHPPRRGVGESLQLLTAGIGDWRIKLILGLSAAAILIFLTVRDLGHQGNPSVDFGYWERPAEYLALRTVVANVLLAFLLILVGWLVLGRRHAIRQRRVDSDITAIGLAGMVYPLLEIEFVMQRAAQGQVAQQDLLRHWAPGKPLKWVKPLLSSGAQPGQAAASMTPGSEQEAAVKTSSDDIDLADLANESLRKVVATLRGWADLLVFGDLGRSAMHCAQSLRVDLQELETRLKTRTCPADCETVLAACTAIQQQALFAATAFEFASRPLRPRPEVVEALSLWRGDGSIRRDLNVVAGDMREKRSQAAVSWLTYYSDQRIIEKAPPVRQCPQDHATETVD